MASTFSDFLSSLLAFESGWDRERYDAGIITDAQLDFWSRGTVQDYFPEHTSWTDLTDSRWEALAYRSLNSFGFVGYQFGEALLIDLGYYDANVTADNADVVLTWNWGKDAIVTDFDPSQDSIFVDWFSAGSIDVREVGASTVFNLASNNQTLTLEAVSLSELSEANFTIKDDGTAGEHEAGPGDGPAFSVLESPMPYG